MDEFKKIESDNNSADKLDFYRQRRAKNVTISVMLYILSVVALIAITYFPTYFGNGDEDKNGVIGILVMFVMIAIATGLLVYTKLSAPSDVAEQLSKESKNEKHMFYAKTNNKKVDAIVKAFMPFVLVVYLAVSFWTGAWHITWIIWLIAAAVRNAIFAFSNTQSQDEENGNQ